MESKKFCLELRKRKENSYVEFTSEELKENPEKILSIMKKEFIHLKSWFLVIVITFKNNKKNLKNLIFKNNF